MQFSWTFLVSKSAGLLIATVQRVDRYPEIFSGLKYEIQLGLKACFTWKIDEHARKRRLLRDAWLSLDWRYRHVAFFSMKRLISMLVFIIEFAKQHTFLCANVIYVPTCLCTSVVYVPMCQRAIWRAIFSNIPLTKCQVNE